MSFAGFAFMPCADTLAGASTPARTTAAAYLPKVPVMFRIRFRSWPLSTFCPYDVTDNGMMSSICQGFR
jgi:hypothetical protein